MLTKSSLIARAMIILVALFALFALYFWVHKPFDLPLLARVGGAALDLSTGAALFGIAGGIGRAALRRHDLSAITRAEWVALETGIGLGVIALAALVFGLLDFFRPPLLWVLLIGIGLLLRVSLLAWLRDCRDLLRSVLRIQSTGEALIMLYGSIMLLLTLLIALAPPAHWDSLTYHLVAAQRYAQAGAVTAQPDNFYLGFSQNVEMLYGLTVGLFGRATAAAPVHFGLGVIGLLATAGVTRRFTGRSTGWLAALLLLSAYNLWALFGWAYVDLGALAYGALALSAALAWRETRARGWLILIGILIGLALGVKYTTVALGGALVFFVLIHEPRRAARNGVLIGVAALLAFAPWVAKGLLLYHNPIYPFVFGGVGWSAQRAAEFSFSAYSLIGRGLAWQLPILPLAATIFGQDNVDGFGFTAGPWLLTTFLLLPLVGRFLDDRARRFARDLLTLLVPLLIFWALAAALNSVGMQTRLMIVAFPVFAAAGAVVLYGLAQFPKKPLDVNFIVRVALALTLALTLLDAVRETYREQALPYLTAQVSAEDVLYANTGAYYNAMQQLPEGSRVRLMWEPRAFYCPPTVTCVADVLFDHWKLPQIDEGLSPDQVFERYRAEGDDYLLVFDSLYAQYLEFSTDPELDGAFPAALARWMEPVWTDGLRYTLYGWKSG